MQSDLIAWPIFKPRRCSSQLLWFVLVLGSCPPWWLSADWPGSTGDTRCRAWLGWRDFQALQQRFQLATPKRAPPSRSAVKSVLRNVWTSQTLSVGDYVAPLLRWCDPVHRSGPGEPSLFSRTNVYNRLGASVEGIQETLAYVCLRFEDCG